MSGSPSGPSPLLSRRNFILTSGVAAAGMVLYSGEFARHELETTHQTISLQNLGSGFHGLRIVQISDIHLDEFTEPYFLSRVVKRVNDLKPDVVFLTGDFVTRGSLTFLNSRHAPYRCAEILSELTASKIYAILGNHDVAFGAPIVIEALAHVRIPVLYNSPALLERGGDRLWIAGVDDPASSSPNLDLAVPSNPQGPVILLAHAPDYADSVVRHPKGHLVDLMLSGHSHGGQVRLPFVGALILPPLGQKYVEGSFRFGKLQLYVNRGIGTVGLPFRLNCPPEITVFTLQSA